VSALGNGGPEGVAHDVMVDVDRLRVRLAGSTVDVVDDVCRSRCAPGAMGSWGSPVQARPPLALALLGHTPPRSRSGGRTVLVGAPRW